MAALANTGEHAADVLSRMSLWLDRGEPCALVVVTSTEGGAVRAPGALMAVNETDLFGYISGGCIDEDVALQAREAMVTNTPKALRYGAGSPFVDLPLPCGGAIDVLIVPNPDARVIQSAATALTDRRNVALRFESNGRIAEDATMPQTSGQAWHFDYAPKLKLRIAGRGADPLALATIAQAAGYGVHLQCVDEEDLAAAKTAGVSCIEKLDTPSALSSPQDDPWTAFVLMFHDGSWEVPLLQQALSGDAFYVGAVGSKRTHTIRRDRLMEAGCSADDIERVSGPIGLVPSLRDASMLAVSTLAEIVDRFPARSVATRAKTAVLLLAAGSASRFGAGDKLLASLNGYAVLEHAASAELPSTLNVKLAVVATGQIERAQILERAGWTVIENPDASLGQSSSLAHGMEAVIARGDIDQIVVILGDMPNVPRNHFDSLLKAANSSAISTVMSDANGVLSPPALFQRQHFEALTRLNGDQGAKAVFIEAAGSGATVPLTPHQAMDIDTVEDLERLKETADA